MSEWTCFGISPGEKRTVPLTREQLEPFLQEGGKVWIDIEAPDEADTDWLGETFEFHELALIDVLNNEVRPKEELYEEVLFTVFSAINLNPGEEELDTINLNIFLTENYLISTHCKPLKTIRSVVRAMQRANPPLKKGTDYLYYRLLDGVVNRYLDIIDDVSERLAEIEHEVFKTQSGPTQERIFAEKRRLAYLKRCTAPQRDALKVLVNEPFPQLSPETQTLLRDVLDHVMRTSDAIESYRDLTQGLMDSYLTQVSNQMNEVMKLMSIIATIMLPLSFLTGLFGMNFEVLPGTGVQYGFWILVVLMLGIVGLLIWFFRRKQIL